MKFCMVTTFFGGHSFGGDAAYVDRLARALLRRGHEVHVIHCGDSFQAVRGAHPLRPYTPPEGLHIHRLESPFGILSPLATQSDAMPYGSEVGVALGRAAENLGLVGDEAQAVISELDGAFQAHGISGDDAIDLIPIVTRALGEGPPGKASPDNYFRRSF